MTDDFDAVLLSAVRRMTRTEGAMWTSDIAWTIREPTARVRSALVRLEKAGAVKRVVVGNPTSWAALTPGEAGN